MNWVIFTIFGYDIRWYSVLLLSAFLVGMYFINRETKRFDISKDFIFNLVFWTLISSVIGARLYYVIFEWNYYSSNLGEILKIWNGGLAIHGGIIAGLLALIAYVKKYNGRVVRFTDFIVPGLIIGQAIGRWGNFFNQEAHGVATTLEHLQKLNIPDFVIQGMKINEVYYTPTFFYESIACLIGFIIICIVRRGRYVKVGTPTAIYLLIYGVVRIFIERSRTDSLMFCGLKVAILVSIIMIIIAVIMLIINSKKGKFEDLYNDKDNQDVIRF